MAILSAVEWGKKLFPTPHIVLSNVEHVATSAPVKYLACKDVVSKCDYKCKYKVQLSKRSKYQM